jgi:hypothetical protein
MTPDEARARLREWIVRTSGRVTAEELSDDLPLLEQRIITSLQITDLILFLEELRQAPVDVTRLNGAALRDVNALCRSFLSEVGHADAG